MRARAGREGPITAAVLGAGRVSAHHLEFLAGCPGVHLAAICDLSNALLRYASERFRAERTFTDHRELLETVRPEVVHVCTPPDTHVALVRDCLAAGAHVICEKPIAPSNAEFRVLWEIAGRQGLVLMEDHNYRFTREFLAVEKVVSEGRIGDVREVEVRVALAVESLFGGSGLPHPSHELPGGIIHEFLPHMAYLALRFLPEFERLHASWNRHGDGSFLKFDDLDALIISGEVHGRLRFSSRQAPDCFQVIVRGSGGWVEMEYFRPYVRLTTSRPGGARVGPLVNHLCNGFEFLRAGTVGFVEKLLQRSVYEGLHRLLGLTYDALREGAPPPVSGEDIDRSTRLIDACVRQGIPA